MCTLLNTSSPFKPVYSSFKTLYFGLGNKIADLRQMSCITGGSDIHTTFSTPVFYALYVQYYLVF